MPVILCTPGDALEVKNISILKLFILFGHTPDDRAILF